MWQQSGLFIKTQKALLVTCLPLVACHTQSPSLVPAVVLDKVPKADVGGPDKLDTIEGHASGVQAGQRIVLCARSQELWWIQPLADHPYTVQGAAEFHVIVEGSPRALRPVIQVYRIAREAIINVFRHSRATRIAVAPEYGVHQLRVMVQENGCGIDSQVGRSGRHDHWGLSGMRERSASVGGTLKVGATRQVEQNGPACAGSHRLSIAGFRRCV